MTRLLSAGEEARVEGARGSRLPSSSASCGDRAEPPPAPPSYHERLLPLSLSRQTSILRSKSQGPYRRPPWTHDPTPPRRRARLDLHPMRLSLLPLQPPRPGEMAMLRPLHARARPLVSGSRSSSQTRRRRPRRLAARSLAASTTALMMTATRSPARPCRARGAVAASRTSIRRSLPSARATKVRRSTGVTAGTAGTSGLRRPTPKGPALRALEARPRSTTPRSARTSRRRRASGSSARWTWCVRFRLYRSSQAFSFLRDRIVCKSVVLTPEAAPALDRSALRLAWAARRVRPSKALSSRTQSQSPRD
jgi:hypothetical protein